MPLDKRKPRPHPKDADGVFRAFTSRKVAALGKKTSKCRLRSPVRGILLAEFSCGFRAPYSIGDNAKVQ
jgi:hypothetical protein